MEFDRDDAKVGALVLAAAAVFLAAAILINRERITAKSYPLSIELAEIAGIDKGVDVVYRGYKAGQVERVDVTYEPRFRFVVRFSVKRDIRLPPGTKALVRGRGFTGGRYLDLVAPDRASGEAVEPGSVLPVELEPDLMAKANDVLGEARLVVRRFQERGTAEDAIALVSDTRAAVNELRKTLANANALVANANALMDENRATLKETMRFTRSATAKTDELLARRGPAADRALKNLDEALLHVPAILVSLEELAADLKKHPWKLVRKGGGDPPKLDHQHGETAAK